MIQIMNTLLHYSFIGQLDRQERKWVEVGVGEGVGGIVGEV